MDEIGYDWKYYDLSGSGKYIIYQKKVFVIRDQQGYLYKLRFIDFYDNNGQKGRLSSFTKGFSCWPLALALGCCCYFPHSCTVR